MNGHKITIVGCGPGALDYLTPAARAAIEAAELLVGAPRLLDAFPTLTADRILVNAGISEVLNQVAPYVGQRKIAVLVTGDPGVFSLAQPVLERFGRAACEIIPGISSVQVAFARIGLGWLDACVISAHESTPSLSPASLAGEKKIAVLAGNDKTLPWIALLLNSLAATHACFVCVNLTLPAESVRQVEPSEMKTIQLPSLAIILLVRKDLLS